MRKPNTIFTILLLLCSLSCFGMEYGLRFKSHPYPASSRTELILGNDRFKFSNEIALGFELAFYDRDCFGIICTMKGNDGTAISLVSSAKDGNYYPGIVINESLNIVPVPFATDDKTQNVTLKLLKKENQAVFIYNKEKYTFPVNLANVSSVEIAFGRILSQVSVAPIEIQDIRIFCDKQNTHSWELRAHRGDSVYDDIKGTLAVARSPQWILDDHTGWTEIYSLETDDKIQSTFDPRTGIFYIVYPDKVVSFNALTHNSKTTKVAADGRVMKYSNYLAFDALTDRLLSYSPETRRTSLFDFKTSSWNPVVGDDQEPYYANHGYATDGTHAYIFGGYGFYMFHNNLVRMDLLSGEMEDITLHPLPSPRTSSSLCVKDNKLYIFGGMGNSIGKQEVPSKYYKELWEYDIKTMKGRKVWETDTLEMDFLPSSSMYYEKRDSCFYFASTWKGGCMMSARIDRPEIKIVSEGINSQMDYRDCVFNLYRMAGGKRYFLVIDKRRNDFSHELAIYTIVYPFLTAEDKNAAEAADSGSSKTWWIAGGILILFIAAGLTVIVNRKKKTRRNSVAATASAPTESSAPAKDDTAELPDAENTEFQNAEVSDDKIETLETQAERKLVIDTPHTPLVSYPDREKSSISFLGRYEIKDKDGNDITPKFSSRIKDLLILVALYSEKDEKGISYKKIDEEIWYDKDEKSAKNNRNVYMRKLRILLEEVGNVEISYDKGYYRIEAHDVCLDYHEAMSLINSHNGDENGVSGESLDHLIQLLLLGPLLPGSTYEWLDKFKSNYTEICLHLLNKLLKKAVESKDDTLAYRIAETISLHDPLSEEALMVKCRILFKRNMKGPARSAYDNFSSEYEKSFGETYAVPFSKIFRPSEKSGE